jgi:tetratricopeptide (TPR) repeat protein
MIATVAFFVLARLRLQVCSVLIIFAAYALVWLGHTLRARNIRRAIPALLALVALSLLVNWPLPSLHPDRHLAKSYNLLAAQRALRGDPAGALREYQRSLAVAPQLATTYLNLAQVYYALGRMDEVWDLHRKALQVDPEVAMAHLNLGNLHAEAGHLDQAIAEYRAELEHNPYNAQAYARLAAILKERPRVRSDSQGGNASDHAE